MLDISINGTAAIVGVGLAGIGEAPGFSHLDLIGRAVSRALDDAGLSLQDIDGLYAANMVDMFPTLVVGDYLGIHPRHVVGTNTGGNIFVDHVISAAMALEAGMCDVALICYGSNQRTAGLAIMPPSAPPYEAVHNPREPITSYAMSAARHMAEFGTTRAQLAEAAVAARAWARLNPLAFERGPLTVDDVLSSRMVCDPLSVRDCCLVTDGAGAIIMTRPDRARDMRKPPIHVLGGDTRASHFQIGQMPDLTTTCAAITGPAALKMAGCKVTDIDLVQLYDAFTINVVLFLEDLGFCPKGEGGRFLEGGRIAPGGELPVNTNGGGLSCVQPGMYGIFTIIEAVEQLRGEAGDRQVGGAELALCHGNGGLLAAQSTVVLGGAVTGKR